MQAESDIDIRRSRVLAATRRENDERIFRSAVRHSRLVQGLRYVVPIGVVVALAVTAAVVIWGKPLRVLAKLPVDIGNIVVSGTKITMQQPRMAGYTQDQRQYELTAQAAAQDLTKPDLVELQGIQARMEMHDRTIIDTTARSGIFDTKSEILTLQQRILVTSSNGLKAELEEALIEIRSGKIVSEKPVEVSNRTMVINANRMEILESGDVVRFEQGVAVTLMAEENPAPKAVSQAGKR